jgi:radical SAM-linked protein
MERLRERKVSLSVSSLRAYGLDEDLLDEIADVRATGLTFAPEAGTQRMRDVVNKNISEADILTTAERVFSRGWQKMKFYFMIGLPTETDEDVRGIAELARQSLDIGRRVQPQHNGRLVVTVSVSSHVPKPHTPFQWAAMDSMQSIERKQSILAELCRRHRLNFRRHDLRVSHVEGIFARGDRRLASLLERVWRHGARFDGWDEHFRWDLWQSALAEWEQETGVSRWLFLGTIPTDARLPWDHIDVGLEDGFLAREWRRAMRDKLSPPCGKPLHAKVHHTNLQDAVADERKLICYNCGVACDMQAMRQERIDHLNILGAERPPEPKGRTNRQQALTRIARGQTPRSLNQGGRFRYRLRHTKLGKATFQGHLDLVREMPRILRRAGLDPYYSEGYHPHAVMSFGPAPQLGMHSLAEVLDMDLTHEVQPDRMLAALNRAAPEGMGFTACRQLVKNERGLSRIIRAVDSLILLDVGLARAVGQRERLEARIREVLASEALWIDCVRKADATKRVNGRATLQGLEVWTRDRFGWLETVAATGGPEAPAFEPWREARLGLFVRQSLTNELQPRVTELASAVTGLVLGPERVVRLAVLAESGAGDLADPLDSPAAALGAGSPDEASRTQEQPQLIQIA